MRVCKNKMSLFNFPTFFIVLGIQALSVEERKVITVAEIVNELIKAHRNRKDINLNALKHRIASKYGLESSPRLVDIIAAVPIDYKKVLVPKLLAKPIRTASGVCYSIFTNNYLFIYLF